MKNNFKREQFQKAFLYFLRTVLFERSCTGSLMRRDKWCPLNNRVLKSNSRRHCIQHLWRLADFHSPLLCNQVLREECILFMLQFTYIFIAIRRFYMHCAVQWYLKMLSFISSLECIWKIYDIWKKAKENCVWSSESITKRN